MTTVTAIKSPDGKANVVAAHRGAERSGGQVHTTATIAFDVVAFPRATATNLI